MANFLFFPLFYLLIRLGIIKRKSRLLLAAVKWADEESMQIIEADRIQYFCLHRGPGQIWFQARNKAGQTYGIRLALLIKNIQSVMQILKNCDASYETKLLSKTQI